jgi:hypothetical protein
MAKQDRYANQAAKQIEVAGRKLRTSNPEELRRQVEFMERFLENREEPLHVFGRRGGALCAAIRLKGLVEFIPNDDPDYYY